MKKILLIFLLLPLICTGCNKVIPFMVKEQPNTQPVNNQTTPPSTTLPPTTTPPQLTLPLDRALERVTKKPFGIKISPTNSPVAPERFAGYHTGADFETFSDEQDKDVAISAICSGQLLVKKYASGYGGVAVQACQIDNRAVTIIYGHLKLDSITAKVGDPLTAGDKLGILGKGYSVETDGERKHLHLGIHQGSSINILGYVSSEADLNNWLDPLKYLK